MVLHNYYYYYQLQGFLKEYKIWVFLVEQSVYNAFILSQNLMSDKKLELEKLPFFKKTLIQENLLQEIRKTYTVW